MKEVPVIPAFIPGLTAQSFRSHSAHIGAPVSRLSAPDWRLTTAGCTLRS